MTVVLHEHPFAAYCWKALVALEERGVPYETVLVEDRAPLEALWPLASIPVLEDDGMVVAESSVVVEHLDRHGNAPPMVPLDHDAALRVRLWDRVIDGYVATPMQTIVGDVLRPEGSGDAYGVAQAHAQFDRIYRVLDDHLAASDGPWLAGASFSLADCAAAPALHYADVLHRLDRDAHPALAAYEERLFARPSVTRVVERARPYRHLFPLPWPAHVA
ncbi:glutathione S-transferase family protein [Conexibacter sp. SYSU D00693]|uniref:glutathione S-transferase family protein n=1 Tax=Conexibacter sp. SYSU D00693 TaxID=2812560 RepID=UPI00196B9DD6|nr:glutathione S-transferase family protein [Conexibacter sp. SYSU D00693]